ncbi:tRNA (adenine(37)-N6)-methyltransferase [Anoplolepis gracilipes]|uniref:tRNA (adenine(37)-N6)-methyltransferase n=1 Tax=Anoplolepis gracilipes TaxID=354296 RepID=UPI003B9E39A4
MDMDLTCRNSSLTIEYLFDQLNTARQEINNLRQQVKSLRYILNKDVDNIKRFLELQTHGRSFSHSKLIASSLEEAKPGTSKDQDILKLKPIGVISTWFPNKRATPRQPGICGKVPGKLTLYNSVFTNPDHALQGLQDFSHMWILFHFHRNDSTHTRAKVAPPRLNGMKIGVFSTRSPHRPCPIGLSLVKILKIENYTIYFEGVDMVNQTPVLDIKPYIPQYDSPLHIEKLNNRSRENNTNVSDMFHNIRETTNSSEDQVTDFFNVNTNTNNDEQAEFDISKDEEIALRLQVEEFQADSNHYITRQPSQLMEPHINSPTLLQINTADMSTETYQVQDGISDMRSDLDYPIEQNATISIAESQIDSIRDLNSRLRNVDINNPSNTNSTQIERNNEIDYTENQPLRNSRLLDGADGPSTVCGTDLDLVNHRVLHARVDNSPVRMGIREAPDGEEGLESQSLTPSRTLPDIHAATAISSLPMNMAVQSNFSEIRVPNWISQPRTTTLSVIFNERALMQLNEISDDKVDEQKQAIENVLREDPRSVYLRQRWGSQFYTFLIYDLHITCRFDDSRGIVTVFQVRHAGRTCDCGEPEWQCLGHSPLS